MVSYKLSNTNFIFLFYVLIFQNYLFGKGRGQEKGRDSQTESLLSVEPDAELNLMTLR